jgi:UrcA family protein
MSSHTASSIPLARRVLAAFVAIAVTIPAAFAQMPKQLGAIPSLTVKYNDLNLSSEDGSRALYGRLIVAARKVCPERADTLLALRQNRDSERCITATVQRAVKEIKHPKFAEVAASHMR